MEIKINVVKVASELAEERLKEPFREAGYTEDEIDTRLFEECDDGVFRYREDYLNESLELYDYYYDKLIKYGKEIDE